MKSVYKLDKLHITKGELAEQLYPGQTWDGALPQPWVDQHWAAFEAATGIENFCGGFIWLYDDRAPLFGRPAPLHTEAAEWLQAQEVTT